MEGIAEGGVRNITNINIIRRRDAQKQDNEIILLSVMLVGNYSVLMDEYNFIVFSKTSFYRNQG